MIAERVRAGLRNARAKDETLGRPRVVVDVRRIVTLRKSGASCAAICHETGLSKGTAQRVFHGLPKNGLRCVSADGRGLESRSSGPTKEG